MIARFQLLCLLLLAVSVHAADKPASLAKAATKTPAPNVLLIVLDDAGYSDIGAFGSGDAPTPNIDRLAKEGVRFTRHYADSTCRPARAALLTGQDSSRVAGAPDFRGIAPEVPTLAELLHDAGYTTHHIGKWHLGDSNPQAWPSAKGFQTWFGALSQFVLHGPGEAGHQSFKRPGYFNPWLQEGDKPPQQFMGHADDILAERVVKIVQQEKSAARPWFINYWLFAPHTPVQPGPEWASRYPDTPEGRYLALLAHMDASVGRVLDAVRESGQWDNTLIILLSDNGGTDAARQSNFPFAAGKSSFQEGGLRTPLVVHWPKAGKRAAGASYDGVVSLQDILPTVLAAAGVAVPPDYAGRNLAALVEHPDNQPVPRPLFWEVGGLYTFNISMLSKDGRWRMVDDHLYDLQADPSGAANVAAKYPDIYASMKASWVDWHRANRQMRVAVEADPAGGWRVTGDSMRRAPGYGAFSLAMQLDGLATKRKAAQYIAQQEAFWDLQLLPDNRLQLRIGTQILESSPVPITACNHLLVNAFYMRSRLDPKQDHAVVSLTWNGQEVATARWEKPPELEADVTVPTWLGRNAKGEGLLEGRMSRVGFYNDIFYRDDPFGFGRDIAWVTRGLCSR